MLVRLKGVHSIISKSIERFDSKQLNKTISIHVESSNDFVKVNFTDNGLPMDIHCTSGATKDRHALVDRNASVLVPLLQRPV